MDSDITFSQQPFLSGNGNEQDTRHERALRPKEFSEYIGQHNVIKNIDLMVQSAVKRKEPMDHVLLSGPPGLGKTSLAMLLSKSLDSQLHLVSGPTVEKKGDVAAILSNLNPRDVLFIDEIHRIPVTVEEILYSAMEDFRLDIIIGQGPSARTMQIDIAPFTLIGATTRSGLLSNPLRDRFLANLHFDFYPPKDLAKILSNNAHKLGLTVSPEALNLMAERARGTPRVAIRILRRVRDFAIVHEHETITEKEVHHALKLMEIDHTGLDPMDRKILQVISSYYNGGPVGIEALAATLGEDKTTIEDVYEPYLLKEGLVIRTPRGRQLSPKATELVGKIATPN